MRGFPRCLMLSAVLVVTACSGGTKEADSSSNTVAEPSVSLAGADASLQQSWGVYVARNSAALTRLLAENPDQGWVKFYNRDYPAAEKAFQSSQSPASKMGAARSHLAEAELFHAAYGLALEVDQAYQKRLEENAGRLKKTDLDSFAAGVRELRVGNMPAALAHLKAFRATSIGQKGAVAAVAAVLEGAALKATGDAAGADAAWSLPAIAQDAGAAALLATYKGEGKPDPKALDGLPAATTEYAKRLVMWAQAEAGQLEAASKSASMLDPKAPDVEETVVLEEGSTARKYTDPLVLKALASVHARQSLQLLEGLPGSVPLKALAGQIIGQQVNVAATEIPAALTDELLPAYLFGRYPTPADLGGAVGVGTGGLIKAYADALGPLPTAPTDGRDTRLAVVTAQGFLDAGKKLVAESKDEEGRNTVGGLKILENDAFLAVRARAETYRENGRLQESLFLLEHVLDKENSKLNFQNDPLLYLSITRVYCLLGRYREALNYSYRLVEARPELWFIQESLGNLSVLDTVDHAGRTGGQD